MSVTDAGNSTNASITAILTSTAGSSNVVTLVATATNSGVFTACTNTSTTGAGGQFLAPIGTQLTLTYSNSVGTVTTTATIIPPPGVPGIAGLIKPSSLPPMVSRSSAPPSNSTSRS